jgi:hypothetical protein
MSVGAEEEERSCSKYGIGYDEQPLDPILVSNKTFPLGKVKC